MIRTFFLALVAVFATLAVYLFFYLGFYKPVEISVAIRGPFHLLYRPHTGAYHLIGPVIGEVEAWAAQNHVICEKTFGEYIDDPSSIDQDRLRSHGGCMIPSSMNVEIPSPFQYETRGEKSYVVAHFDGSPSIGPFKVYPKVQKYLAEQHLKSSQPVIETYVVHGSHVDTEFLFPLD
jgi:AraC family transcriptional regulator